MHLQEVMAGAGGGQLEEVKADAAAAARRHGEGEQQAGRRQVVGLDALACRTGPHVLVHSRRQAWPPHRAAGQGERLVATEVPAQRRSVELAQHLRAQLAGRRHAKAVAPRTPAVEQPVTADEAAARRVWLIARRARGGKCAVRGARSRRLGRRSEGPQDRVGGKRGAERGRKVGVEEARSLGVGASGNEGGRGARAIRHEELERGIRVVIARVRRRAGAVGEALPGKEVCGVGAARDVHDAVLVLGEQVEPARLVVAYVPLLLQPLQARVVGVQLEGLVE